MDQKKKCRLLQKFQVIKLKVGWWRKYPVARQEWARQPLHLLVPLPEYPATEDIDEKLPENISRQASQVLFQFPDGMEHRNRLKMITLNDSIVPSLRRIVASKPLVSRSPFLIGTINLSKQQHKACYKVFFTVFFSYKAIIFRVLNLALSNFAS